MSQGKSNPHLLNLFSNRDTLLYVYSQGLFAEHMKAVPGNLDHELGMHLVLDANDDCHCNPWFPLLDESIGCSEQFCM